MTVWKDIALWVLGVGATMALSIGGYFGNAITGILKSIRDELKKLTGISIKHDERIEVHREKLEDHEIRLRELEK